MKGIFFFIVLFLLASAPGAEACTSVIITGKATPDGRPLMWKHRDTEEPFNHIAFFDDGGYSFLGLVNSSQPDGGVWTGTNETGFTLMNTASFNLKEDDVKEMDQEGMLMRKALSVCRTTQDFEHFLDTLPRPLRVEANFGVIDANGGAAYYETNNLRYFKKDVNDARLAPEGYLIYTNFSTEGRTGEGLGYIRYASATDIFKEMQPGGFTPERILQQASRSFYNSQLGIDLKKEEQSPNKRTGWFVEQDMIPRSETTAAIVIQGVSPGMNPELTTMWTVLGYPPVSVALPLWVKMGEKQPVLVLYNERDKTAPLCFYASVLKDKVYSLHRGNGQKYLHWQLLWNESGTGYMQQAIQTEDRIFNLYDTRKTAWEKNNRLDVNEVRELYKEASEITNNFYSLYLQQPGS